MTTRTIWKYPLAITDVQEVVVPKHAKFISVDVQDGQLCAWAEVDRKLWAEGARETRRVTIIGTGNPLWDGAGEFLGTVQMPPFVWHVYIDVK